MPIEISRKQAQYIREANHRWNIKMGATQSGKTFLDTRYLIPSRLLERKGKDGLNFIVGVTKETIERNVLSKMRSIWGVDKVSEINSKNRATLFGEMVYCIGAKDKGQAAAFRGATAKYLYIDEFPDISEDVFSIFSSRLSMPYSCADMTGNPKDPKHWSEDFIASDKDIYFQRYALYDNPFLTAETIANIERDYKGTVYFDRYVLGLPKRAEGLCFPLFADNPSRWIIKMADVPKQFRTVEVGFDIGGNGSAYAMTCTGQGYDGTQYRLKSEKRQAEDMAMEDIEKFVNEFCEECEREYGVKIGMINCDHIAVIVNTINDNTKYRADLCYKPPVADRVFLYNKMFANDKIKFVEGMCDDLIDELESLVFDEKAEDTRPLDDGSVQLDCYDSACYSESSYWYYIEM
jgi:PBSX family phage terminase large subunit